MKHHVISQYPLRQAQRPLTGRTLLCAAFIATSSLFTLNLLAPLSPGILLSSAQAAAEEPLTGKSQLLKSSSKLKVGAPVPFFSGWLSNGQTFSKTKLLKQGHKRYVVTVCNSSCVPCFRGLHALTQARAQFAKRDIGVVVYVADNEANARALERRFSLQWTDVVVDKFKVFSRKFAANREGTLELPRTFVLDAEGRVELIIGQEGADYIKLLLGK